MELRHIPLELLRFAGAEDAIRFTGATEGIDELRKNIEMFGLLVPLLVRPDPDDLEAFIVVDGNRRLAALKQMNGPGDSQDRLIACVLGNGEEISTGAALSANTMRQAMNLMDEYDVYARMIAQGNKPNTIARVFGRKQKEVTQILALAALHDDIKNAVRNEKLGWEAAQALTLVKDQEQQFKLWKDCGDSHWKIRQSLLDRKPQMIYALFDRALYEEKGGTYVVDLFRDEGETEDLADNVEVFWQLQMAAIEEAVQKLKDEGWAGVVKGGSASHKADCPLKSTVKAKKKRKDYVVSYNVFPNGQFTVHETVEPTSEKRKADKEALKAMTAPASAASQKNGDDRAPAREISGPEEAGKNPYPYTDHDLLIIIRNLLEQHEWSGSLCGEIAEWLGKNGIEVIPDRDKLEDVNPETGEVTEFE